MFELDDRVCRLPCGRTDVYSASHLTLYRIELEDA